MARSDTNNYKVFIQHALKRHLNCPQQTYMRELNKIALQYGLPESSNSQFSLATLLPMALMLECPLPTKDALRIIGFDGSRENEIEAEDWHIPTLEECDAVLTNLYVVHDP